MKKILFIIIFVLSFSSSSVAMAMSVSMYSVKEVNVGESFKVLLSLDSDETPINSVDIVVEFNPELLTFVGFRDNDTLVKTWIEKPEAEGDKINMKGIIPGGVSGVYDSNNKNLKEIPIVNLLFKAKNKGNAEFIFNKSNILKNDGLGTSLYPTQNKLNIIIKGNSLADKTTIPDEFLIDEKEFDENPPLPFVISFVEASSLSQTGDMIVFYTTDAESGIKEYRIKNKSDWDVVSSPLIISKNILPKDVVIRAYDNHDNFTEASITIKGRIGWNLIVYVLIFVILSSILVRKLLK